MFGLIGKIKSSVEQRDALIAVLLEGTSGMPGCLSYIVAKDAVDPEVTWVTEVWQSREAHRASLARPSVQQAIAKGRPLITGFGERFETEPVGGQGLVSDRTGGVDHDAGTTDRVNWLPGTDSNRRPTD